MNPRTLLAAGTTTVMLALGAVSASAATAAPATPAQLQGDVLVAAEEAPARPDGVTRLYGQNRFETAVAISADSFPDGADEVFIVTGTDWPDALAAGAAAAEVDAPVLLVWKHTITDPVITELERLSPERAWVVGGIGAVSRTVERQLEALDIEPQRVAGADRYGTAAALQEQFFPDPEGAYYASGETFADALGGGAAAAHRGWPLLLTGQYYVPLATPVVGDERILLGGEGAADEHVRGVLSARRVAGDDRYGTAAATALDAFGSARVAYLATGTTYPDALAGVVAAARDQAPLLITRPSCAPEPIAEAADELGVTARVALGGTAAVNRAAADLQVCPAP